MGRKFEFNPILTYILVSILFTCIVVIFQIYSQGKDRWIAMTTIAANMLSTLACAAILWVLSWYNTTFTWVLVGLAIMGMSSTGLLYTV